MYPYPSKYLYELDYYMIDEGCVNVYSLKEEIQECMFKECDRDNCDNRCLGSEDYCKEHRHACSYVLRYLRGSPHYCDQYCHNGLCDGHRG